MTTVTEPRKLNPDDVSPYALTQSSAKGAGSPFSDSPMPLPDSLSPVDQFDMEMLPESLRPWISDIAERMQCPPDYLAATAMAALGVAVGRRVAVRPKRYDDWFVVPNMWACIVGPPGVMKSPAQAAVLSPLKRLDAMATRNS